MHGADALCCAPQSDPRAPAGIFGGFNKADPFPPMCVRSERITHPGCFGYWNYVSRPKRYYFDFLPSYTCDASNDWCAYGKKPPTGESCPELTWSQQFRLEIGVFLDDILARASTRPCGRTAPA